MTIPALRVLFTLTKKGDNSFLQSEQVQDEATLQDGMVTFTKGVEADTEYVVKAVVVNYVGENDGVELEITTPEENGKESLLSRFLNRYITLFISFKIVPS